VGFCVPIKKDKSKLIFLFAGGEGLRFQRLLIFENGERTPEVFEKNFLGV
jgi:hypothetical protein